jgi:hypothetical protein
MVASIPIFQTSMFNHFCVYLNNCNSVWTCMADVKTYEKFAEVAPKRMCLRHHITMTSLHWTEIKKTGFPGTL